MESKFLTPPMGWNSWYCFSEGVSEEKIKEMAQNMVSSRLNEHKWNYINVDDCWQGTRGGKFNAIQGNERFQNIKSLIDFVHSLGLKFGLYSTPWISSYAGFIGGSSDYGEEIKKILPENERKQKYQFYGSAPNADKLGLYRIGEQWLLSNDIKQWNEWAIDFIKIDWFPNDIKTTKKIFDEINIIEQNILLSLSNNTPIENMPEIGNYSNMWRISGDVTDTWESIYKIGFEIAPKWMKFARPGHWNDLDMLQIGNIGTPNTKNISQRKSNLTFEEQKTQFVLWSMYSAPLFLSCDLSDIDKNTFELLTNDDVIAIDQDILCSQPQIISIGNDVLQYEKKLSDGKKAIAIFNLNNNKVNLALNNDDLYIDLFTKQNVDFGKIEIPPHGCIVAKLV